MHGDFGLASEVDYYQVQMARWSAADVAAWELDKRYVPSPAAFAPVSQTLLTGFSREYYELETLPFGIEVYVSRSEAFGPNTVAGIDALYKSRARFEQEYRDAHGGANPAPDFASGWYWQSGTRTRLFGIESSELTDDLYSFRIVGYHQTGVDASGQPTLERSTWTLPTASASAAEATTRC